MNNLFTTLVTGLALLFTMSVQANLSFPAFPSNNIDHKNSINSEYAVMDDFTVTASSVSGEVGDNVCIEVTVDNFDDILSFQYSINFDETALQFDTILDSGNVPDLNFGVTNTNSGQISILWFDEDDAMGETFPDGTSLFQVCFEIISNPSGSASIDFTGNPTSIEITDGDENPVGFASNSGTVAIGGAAPLSVSATTVTAANGDNVCLDITANNFTNLTNVQYSMNFDASVLMFDQFMDAGSLTGLMLNSSGAGSGNLTATWNSGTGVTLANGTSLYQVCFNVIGAGGTSSSLSFSSNPTAISVTDADGGDVQFISNNGGVNVSGGGGGGNNGTDFTVTVQTASGNVGDQVCLDVTVANFNDILSFQYSMNFDPSVLQFDEIVDPENIPDLTFGTNNTNAGNISVLWFDEDDAMGETYPDGTVLYQVCFTILSTGNGDVSFSGNPTPIEITDGDENPVTFDSNSGGINPGGGGGGGGNPSTDFTVILSNGAGNVGDQVCLDVTVENFDDILSFQYSMNFDPAVLQFDEIVDPGNIPDLTFGTNNTNAGNISVLWFDEDDAMGETYPDGTLLYQVCFTVLSNGNGNVSFSGNPTPIEITDGDENPVNFDSQNGTVTTSGGGGGGGNDTDFTVSASTVTGNIGDQVCIDVTVENFDNILSFQYSMNFDPALLQFDEIVDPENIPDLTFGTNNTNAGNISVLWFDEDDAMGETYPDGTLLYQVCFTILGGNGVVPVSFSGSPTPVEITDGNEDPVVFASNNGGVDVGGTPPAAMLTVSAPNVTANNGDQVCLDINVNGFTNIANFQYTVNFNSSVLSFVQNMDSGALTGLSFDNSNSGSGTLLVSWDNNGTGVNLNNGTTIYQICFNVIGAGGTSSNVSFSNGTVADGNGGTVNFNNNNGSVNVMTVNNGTDFTVSGGTVSGNAGDQVCIDVTVDNFDNILSFQYSMNFDPALLQFDEIIDPGNIPDLTFGTNNASAGNISVLWFDEDDAMGETYPDGTVLYQICFTILAEDGTVPVSFSGSPTPVEVTDGNEDPVVFASNSGSVVIGGSPMVTFFAPTVTASMGDQVCVNITANNFTDIASFQYSMNFDPTVLAFDQNMSNGNFANIVFDNSGAASGNLVVTWNNNGAGVTLANGATVYQVCFNVIGDGGESSSLTFSGNPTATGATNSNGGDVGVNGNNGAINVMATNNGTDFIVTGGTVNGEVGDQVCIDVTVENFNDILSFQYSMNFDPALLQFDEIVDPGNIPDLTFGITGASNGDIAVLWFDEDDAEGETFPDGTVLYQICFTILGGTTGETIPVTFSGSPTPIEVTDGNEDPVVFGSNAGSIIIGIDSPPVIFNAPDDMANSGANVCVDITTNDFNEIANFQYTLNFNQSILNFDQNISNGNLSNLMFDNSGAANGSLVVSWNNNGTGVSLPNGTVIYQLCFNVIGAGGTTSNLTFANGTAANGSGGNVPVTSNNGSIMVIDSPCQGTITIANQTVMNVSPCAGANNGSIMITDAGGNGAGANSYVWREVGNPAILAATIDLLNVGAGMYELTITGCSGDETLTEVFTITEPDPIVLTANPTPVACNGESTGSISTTTSGGAGGYTFTWNPSTVMGENPTALPAGTYFVTATDNNGCTTSFGPIEVTEPAEAFTGTATPTNPACFGETGSITVDAMGGTTGYMFTLNDGVPQSNPTFDNLSAGTYEVDAEDANGCTFSVADITITEPAEIVISEDSSTDDMGNCEGSINISVTGGNPGGFTYNWTGPSGPFSSEDISNLCAGEYCVTATDNVGGCTATFCKTLIQPLEISLVSSQGACFDNCNGAAIIEIIGGDGDYTVAWMPGGQTIINPDNLCEGLNTVTVTSGDGQMATLDVMIEGPSSPVVINTPVLTNPISATECTGSISITPAGGYGGSYSVAWDPAQGGMTTIEDLCAGTYTATVTDVNGCTATESYTLESPDLEIIDLTSVGTSCNGLDDGQITFGVVGGTTPYTVEVMGAAVVPVDPNTTYSYSNLASGVYLITVTDGVGDTETTTVEVEAGGLIETSIVKIVDATANTLGSIEIAQPTGGTPPYSYMWSGGPNINAMNPDDLNPNTYSLTITDAAGCFVTLVDFATVYLLEVTSEELTNPPCSGNEEGGISVTTTDVINNPPFTYAWADSDGTPVGTNSPDLTNVPGGTYTLTVIDACGTAFTETYVLVAASNLQLDVMPTTFNNGFNFACNGDDDGGAIADISTGTAPYTYEWSNGAMTQTVNGLSAGTYAVTVEDAAGCTATGETLLTEPPALTVDFDIDSISCNGMSDGFITAMASGGVNLGGYEYFWNNGEIDNTIGPVGPGNYTVEVTDNNGCVLSQMVPLPEPEVLDFTFEVTPVTETELGAIQLFPTGGTEPYFYTWPAGINGESLVEDLNFGTYAVIVTDANGCTKMNTGIQVELNTDCFEGSTVITPNDDSLNDVFKITCAGRVKNLEIFNRWGQLVYEVDTYANEWDGRTRRGTEVPEGTYFYIFEYDDVNTGTTEQKRGHLTLLRN